MNVSIMQPYLFPYIGYFQLMASADIFVVHDDVQYIKGGWINRNRILSSGEPRWVTLPVAAGAHRLNINQRCYAPGGGRPRQFLWRLKARDRAAPNFAEVFELVRTLLPHVDRNVPRSTRTHSGASPNRSESRLR
jgi:WbqC-like protein family